MVKTWLECRPVEVSFELLFESKKDARFYARTNGYRIRGFNKRE